MMTKRAMTAPSGSMMARTTVDGVGPDTTNDASLAAGRHDRVSRQWVGSRHGLCGERRAVLDLRRAARADGIRRHGRRKLPQLCRT